MKPVRFEGLGTKTQDVCNRLNERARLLGPAAKLPTIVELRDEFGVSITTLHNALNELEAQDIIYRRHGSGIYVSPRVSHQTVCVICGPHYFTTPDSSPFWTHLLDRTRQRAESNRELLCLHFATAPSGNRVPLQEPLARQIQDGRIHGIIGLDLPVPAAQWIASREVPLVTFAGASPYTVGIDTPRLIQQGVVELAEQGCRRIGLWMPDARYATHDDERINTECVTGAFQSALTERSLSFYPTAVRGAAHAIGAEAFPPTGPSRQQQGYAAATTYFGAHTPLQPDGIVITDDLMTQGALLYMQQAGIRLGRDVRIASRANRGSSVLQHQDHAVTLLEIDPHMIVQALFRQLDELMAGGKPAQQYLAIQPQVRPAAVRSAI